MIKNNEKKRKRKRKEKTKNNIKSSKKLTEDFRFHFI